MEAIVIVMRIKIEVKNGDTGEAFLKEVKERLDTMSDEMHAVDHDIICSEVQDV